MIRIRIFFCKSENVYSLLLYRVIVCRISVVYVYKMCSKTIKRVLVCRICVCHNYTYGPRLWKRNKQTETFFFYQSDDFDIVEFMYFVVINVCLDFVFKNDTSTIRKRFVFNFEFWYSAALQGNSS